MNNLNAPSFGTSRLYFARRRGRLELRSGVAALISFDISHFKSCLVSVIVFIAFHDVFMFFFCGEMRHIERHDNHEIQQPAKDFDLLRCLGHDVTLMSGSSSKTSFFVVPLWHVSFSLFLLIPDWSRLVFLPFLSVFSNIFSLILSPSLLLASLQAFACLFRIFLTSFDQAEALPEPMEGAKEAHLCMKEKLTLLRECTV